MTVKELKDCLAGYHDSLEVFAECWDTEKGKPYRSPVVVCKYKPPTLKVKTIISLILGNQRRYYEIS